MISILIVFITVYKFEEKNSFQMKFYVEIENTNSWVVVVYKLQGKYENTIVFYLLKYLICRPLRVVVFDFESSSSRVVVKSSSIESSIE